MPFANQKGNVIAYVIIAMTTIAALGVGALYMTSSSALGELGANNLNKAYFLALAGKDYALIKNLGDTASYPSGRRDFTLSNGDLFGLTIGGNNITSTGIVNIGTPFEARRQITITKTGFSSRPDISFAKDIQSFAPPIGSPGGFITKDTAAGQILLGQQYRQFGTVWYAPSSNALFCPDGKCDFGTGFRTYFVFKIVPDPIWGLAHGFTFTIFNGNQNNISSIGGAFDMPELLAYAGDSRDQSGNFLDGVGNGIRPPKVAIEFDAFSHSGHCNQPWICGGNSRCDGSRNHMAYVFWGDVSSVCADITSGNPPSFDDNKHGSGSVSNPQNAVSDDLTDTIDYFTGILKTPSWSNDWLLSTSSTQQIYAFRMEVTRGDNTNRHFYTINTWIKKCNDATCSEFDNTDFDNTKAAYGILPVDLPTLKRTIELDGTYHSMFDTFLFGWTAATGTQSAETVTVSKFKMNFIKESLGCGGYAVWNNLGSSGYFRINGVGCATVANNAVIRNIGLLGSIDGFTDALCTISSSPSSITFAQAAAADTNKNCEVYFNGTDK
jgi:hypothetical protein